MGASLRWETTVLTRETGALISLSVWKLKRARLWHRERKRRPLCIARIPSHLDNVLFGRENPRLTLGSAVSSSMERSSRCRCSCA